MGNTSISLLSALLKGGMEFQALNKAKSCQATTFPVGGNVLMLSLLFPTSL